jgi:hypothetical protein
MTAASDIPRHPRTPSPCICLGDHQHRTPHHSVSSSAYSNISSEVPVIFVATPILEVGVNMPGLETIIIFDIARPKVSIKRMCLLEDQELRDHCVNEIVQIIYIQVPTISLRFMSDNLFHF